ncbi:hypothetical protein KIN20_020069 [Parelaphostrongylus tenuis]|uniref:PDZ domain-containing protein n=1 Tax=Parelaphostrongylus tenuis TaxID=148309 RepID=A0AAD5QSY5_PARTN|nr:hypothetical protein KIN20_020069 [Parelaphostrongylus tenuis]
MSEMVGSTELMYRVTYITAADARVWKERFHRENEVESPVINRLSPKVFPKFYRSPYLSRKGSLRDTDDTEPLSDTSEIANIQSPSEISEVEMKEEKERDDKPLDLSVLENFALQIIQEVFRDAIIDFLMSNTISDWKPKIFSRTHSEASSSRGSPSKTRENFPIASSSGSQLGSPDRDGSPPYTILRKDSQTSKSSRASEANLDAKKLSPSKSNPPSEANTKVSSSVIEEKKTRFERSEDFEKPECSNVSPTQPATEHEPVISKTYEDVAMSSRTSSSGSANTTQKTSITKPIARSKFWGEARTVVLQREPNKSFGISIVGGRVEVSQKGGLPGTGSTVSGIFIKSVLPNSPAGKSGMMNMGDRVISVNDIDLREATHEQAVNAIKNATNPVRFVLQSLHSCIPQQQVDNFAPNSMGTYRVESAKPEEQTESPNKISEIHESPKRIQVKVEKEHVLPTQPINEQPTTSSATNYPSKESEVQECANNESMTAQQEGIQKADTSSNRKNDSVSTVKRDSLRSGEFRRESGPLIVSDVSSSETHEDEPSTSAVPFDPTMSSSSAAQLKKNPDDDEPESAFGYTQDKIKRKYAKLSGNLLLVSCERVPEAGLGISLAGNRDREKNSTFVLGVKVQCPLTVRAGDELLEVNGQVLAGHSHLVASSIIRQCCDKGDGLEFVVCRRDGSMDDVAIRPPEPPVMIKEENVPEPMPPTVDVSAESSLHNLENARKKSFGLERTTAIETGRETLIEIDKDGKGLGLSIVGGSDTVLGTVVIHEVYPDGAAAHDGRLKPGDQVLEVNNFSLRGVTHDQAISALRRTPPKVRLLIYRDVNLQLSLLDPTQIYNIFEVELVKKPGRGLGLSIVGRKNEPGVYVSEVVKGGAAEADNRLMTGDQILAVNGQDVANSMQEDVAAMLKTCVGRVCLKVGRWKITETANRVHAAAEAALAKSHTTPRTEESRQADLPERCDVPSPAPPLRPLITHTSPEGEAVTESDPHLSPVTEEPSSGADMRSLLEEDRGSQGVELLHDLKEEGSDTLLFELKKIPDQQLGMGIGKRSRGILVTSLQPGSVAAEKLKVGDRILAVNALPVTDQLSAVTYVKASGVRLFLQIARPRISPQ